MCGRSLAAVRRDQVEHYVAAISLRDGLNQPVGR
jgi:hypothetical protein